MLKSVIMTGDAGALPYLQNDLPKTAFNFCCSCTLPKNEQETNLAPIKKRTIKRERQLSTSHSLMNSTPSIMKSTPSILKSTPPK